MDSNMVSPPPGPRRARYARIALFVAAFVLLLSVFGGMLWYADQNKRAGPAFDPAKQFVPEGAESRDVDQTLAAFGFSKPLPFFEKENVVQSLNLPNKATSSPATASSKAAFLSYRILGQDKAAVRETFREYFTSIGWKMVSSHADLIFIFSFHTQSISVNFIDIARVQGTDQPAVVVALSALK